MHQMLAGISGVPELALEENEAKKIAAATSEVAKHYNFNATPKQLAWFNFSLCAGGIYGAKFFEYTARMKMEKRMKPAANEENAAQSNGYAMTGMPDLQHMVQ